MRILVAEDSPTATMLLQGYLAQWGHEMVSCSNGAEAWEILQQPDAPQLAILDWLMPEVDGIEVCRRVRAVGGSMMPYIIFVTSQDHEDDIVVGLQEGADDYVTKPFSKNELQARLTVGTRVVGMWNRLIEAERNRVLMQTAGAAAHEINNPLAVMSGQIQLLLTKPLDDDIKEKLQGIRDAGTRVSEIVNKMKSISEYVTKPYTKGTDIIDFGSEADK